MDPMRSCWVWWMAVFKTKTGEDGGGLVLGLDQQLD